MIDSTVFIYLVLILTLIIQICLIKERNGYKDESEYNERMYKEELKHNNKIVSEYLSVNKKLSEAENKIKSYESKINKLKSLVVS